MPYYRIVIWTKKRVKPYSGIRFYETSIINSVQQQAHGQAYQKFNSSLIDIEVQMLSKLSTAIKEYIRQQK